jgi:predicted RNase H-like HicB family nuclease
MELAMNEHDVVTKYFASVPVQVAGKSADYTVELIRSEEGYAVGCPSLPGCWSQGDTEKEALANIADAIKDYLEVTAELKQRKSQLTMVA